MTLTPQQRRERAKEQVEDRQKGEEKRNKISQAKSDINFSGMPPWAQVLYHQQELIMDALGIEE